MERRGLSLGGWSEILGMGGSPFEVQMHRCGAQLVGKDSDAG